MYVILVLSTVETFKLTIYSTYTKIGTSNCYYISSPRLGKHNVVVT